MAGGPAATATEADIIGLFRGGASRADLRLGIGDDAAVVVPAPGAELVIAADMIVADTHFPAAIAAHAVGHRALAVNLSDLAAMGAVPRWATLCIALPSADLVYAAGFAAGFKALAERTGTALVGGDTVRGPLGAAVTVGGELPPGTAIRRSTARVGDLVFVSGTPGDAVVGRLLPADATGGSADALRARFLYPEPRLMLGQALRGIATAMLDVSDGLHQDLVRLAAASGVAFCLAIDAVPLSPALRELGGAAAVDHALTGGDDYELAFTAPADAEGKVAAVATATATPVTRIGRVVAGSGVRWQGARGDYPVAGSGWQHFP